jgi:hypothetical protein
MPNSQQHGNSSIILTQPTEIIENNSLSETWTNDIIVVLNNIRINSVLLSKYHKNHYLVLQGKLRYFRIPIIILSAISTLFNLGLNQYMLAQEISLLCAVLSLITGLIGSIELYLQLQRSMENSLVHSRDFYLLAVEIQKCLLLTNENRNGDAVTYLNFKFNDYTRLIETSNILSSEITDELTPIPIDVIIKMPYDERVRNNFIIDERQYMENFRTYEISMGINDISNIFVQPFSRNISRSNSIDLQTHPVASLPSELVVGGFQSPDQDDTLRKNNLWDVLRNEKLMSMVELTHPRRTSKEIYRSRQNSNAEEREPNKVMSLFPLTHPRRTSNDSYKSRQNSINSFKDQTHKKTFANSIRSIHTRLFSRLSDKNINNSNNNDNLI